MKRLLLIAAILFTVVGCERPTMVDGKLNFEKGKSYAGCGQIDYIMFDGHEYVLWCHGNRGGITHSPKCKCLKRFK